MTARDHGGTVRRIPLAVARAVRAAVARGDRAEARRLIVAARARHRVRALSRHGDDRILKGEKAVHVPYRGAGCGDG